MDSQRRFALPCKTEALHLGRLQVVVVGAAVAERQRL